jgi:hypothetical protein
VPGKDRLVQLAGEVRVAGQQLAGVGIYDPEALLPEGLVQRRLAALHSQEGSQLRSAATAGSVRVAAAALPMLCRA